MFDLKYCQISNSTKFFPQVEIYLALNSNTLLMFPQNLTMFKKFYQKQNGAGNRLKNYCYW